MGPNCWTSWSRRAAAVVVSGLCLPVLAAGDTRFDVSMWPGGRVPYRFTDGLDLDPWGQAAVPLDVAESLVEDQMAIWAAALAVRDPRNPAQVTPYLQFVRCPDRCEHETNYVLIRQDSGFRVDGRLVETNNLCAWRDEQRREFLGRGPAGIPTHLHLEVGQDANTIRHELGHCLGLWHEFNRDDADGWLEETRGEIGADFANVFNRRPVTLMPMLGNYDYDSIMHYRSLRTHTFTDTNPSDPSLQQPFSRWRLDLGLPPAGPLADGVSARDRSRVLQYYARERYPAWGFFEPSHAGTAPVAVGSDVLPDPLLAPGVRAQGTPAVAHRGDGAYDMFVRGSDQQIYWKAVARVLGVMGLADAPGPWIPLGCCLASDPAALSRAAGTIDLVAVGNHGRPMHATYDNGAWGAWLDTPQVAPLGGLRPAEGGGFLGAALASREAESLDLFVVKANGALAVSTLSNGAWGLWRDLGAGYALTAQPAAVALSATGVELAVVVGTKSPLPGGGSVNRLHEVPVVMAEPPALLAFALGAPTATVARNAAPALAAVVSGRYRALIVTEDGRIAHRYSWTGWRDIGGIPLPGTGVAAVSLGGYSVEVVMNGEDAVGCSRTCLPAATVPGHVIQPGGLWVRKLLQ